MKKFLLVVLAAVLFVSCSTNFAEEELYEEELYEEELETLYFVSYEHEFIKLDEDTFIYCINYFGLTFNTGSPQQLLNDLNNATIVVELTAASNNYVLLDNIDFNIDFNNYTIMYAVYDGSTYYICEN